MITLKGKVALITGASLGIGRATAILFSKLGSSLILNGRNEEKLDDTIVECEKSGNCEILKVVGDLKDSWLLKHLVDEGVKKFERINILVNDAGVLEDYSGLEDIDMNVFDDTINTNLRAVVELTKYAIPHLIKSKGNVVNVSSIAGLKGTKRGHLAYAISKAGLNLFTVNSAVEFASRGVRFNAVNPGIIETPLPKQTGMNDKEAHEYYEKAKQSYPIGRIGTPDEVAKLIAFLASDDASFITGDLIKIDGGKSATASM